MRALTVALICVALVATTVCAQSLTSTASLSAAAEVPTCATGTGSGSTTITVDVAALTFSISATFKGLSTTATAAHIHGPALTTAAGDVVKVLTLDTSASTLTLTGSFTTAQMTDLLSGLYYVNLHTSGCANGELRGNFLIWTVVGSTTNVLTGAASLTTASEVPSCTGATGSGSVTVLLSLSQGISGYSLDSKYTGTSSAGTAAHIHGPATASTSGDVVRVLTLTTTAVTGLGALTAVETARFLTGQYYINIHTSTCPNGELRANVARFTTVSSNAGSMVGITVAIVLSVLALVM